MFLGLLLLPGVRAWSCRCGLTVRVRSVLRGWWVARAFGASNRLIGFVPGALCVGRLVWGSGGVGGGFVEGARPLLENCTVDASIFVVKLVRAHGGCLGTRSR